MATSVLCRRLPSRREWCATLNKNDNSAKSLSLLFEDLFVGKRQYHSDSWNNNKRVSDGCGDNLNSSVNSFMNLSVKSCLNSSISPWFQNQSLSSRKCFSSAPTFYWRDCVGGRRWFSDNLLGYSPMAPGTPKSSSTNNASDNNTSAASSSKGPVWGVDSNTAGGGVWSQTSAKRDKLNELLGELSENKTIQAKFRNSGRTPTLDDAATPDEALDLELADGLKCIASFVDNAWDAHHEGDVLGEVDGVDSGVSDDTGIDKVRQDAAEATRQLFQFLEAAASPDNDHSNPYSAHSWNKDKFQAVMNEALRILNLGLPPPPPKKPTLGQFDISNPLSYLRDFAAQDHNASPFNNSNIIITDDDDLNNKQLETMNQITSHAFQSSTILYRTLLLRATIQTLKDHWEALTTVTSGDIDRAAIHRLPQSQSSPSNEPTPLPQSQYQLDQRSVITMERMQSILKLLHAYSKQSCSQWVKAWWDVIDADSDERLDQEEMEVAVNLSITPVHVALEEMLQLALEVCPSRPVNNNSNTNDKAQKALWFMARPNDEIPLHHIITNPFLSLDNSSSESSINTTNTNAVLNQPQLSRRQRRQERRARKTLLTTFQKTLVRHFRDQVETPHRLRCIYAWAEKSHQNNKIDSVLIDAETDITSISTSSTPTSSASSTSISSSSISSSPTGSFMTRKRYVELLPKISHDEFVRMQQRHLHHLDQISTEIISSYKEDLWIVQGKQRQNKELRKDCIMFLLGVSVIDWFIMMA